MKSKLNTIIATVFAAALFLPGAARSMQTGAAPAQKTDTGKSAARTPPPSAQNIADARSKGLVWVNLSNRVYHKDGEFYGKTKRGKFMTEDEASQAGFHEAKQPRTTKKASTPGSASTNKKQGDQSGTDATVNTHNSTPPKP